MSVDIGKDKLLKAYYKLENMCQFCMALADDRKHLSIVSRKISKAYEECKKIKENDKKSINQYYLLCKDLYLEFNIAKRKSIEKVVVNELGR